MHSTNNILDNKLLTTVYNRPEEVLESLGLVYVTDNNLSISRIKSKDSFLFKRRGKVITNKRRLARFNNLVIPPAWNEVKICHLKNGHIQAVGRDEKGRKQYIYHDQWRQLRNQTKFYKMYDFGKALPKIRKTVDKHLNQKTWNQQKVLALIIKLLEETHIRIGNRYYAKNNKTYGLSTLRSKHVLFNDDNMVFEFVGKKGKKHQVSITNKRLIKLVNKCEELPGWELFKYFDESGKKQVVESNMVNSYLHEIGKDIFTAKDFRTWSASVICFETLKKKRFKKNQKKRKKTLLKAIDKTARSLNNTRAVSKKYYIHPAIINGYENNGLEDTIRYSESIKKESPYFTKSERAVLKLIKNYTPKIVV